MQTITMKKFQVATLLLVALFLIQHDCAPPQSLVVRSSRIRRFDKEGDSFVVNKPEIYYMRVESKVNNRFAYITIASKVRNLEEKSQEAVFSVILPEHAFISGFVMEVDGKNYTAYVKEKEEAKKTYDEAVAMGLGAAYVAVSVRDSNRFSVSVNVEPNSKASFYLSYEELLQRKNDHYELVVNLHPGQPVKDLSVEVVIAESRKITKLKAPPMRSGNDIRAENSQLDPRADLEIVNDTVAIVKFSPNTERQKELTGYFGTQEKEGLAGQFLVEYDVERDPSGGEVLIQDGYFVHFFAPSDLLPLPKHVVFILDTSSSMRIDKINQLKAAMHKILDQLNEVDLFHLVEFNTNVRVWDLNNVAESVWFPSSGQHSQRREEVNFEDVVFPRAYKADRDTLEKAKATVSQFQATASTDINTALKVGLHLVEVTKYRSPSDNKHQPIIMFLTDGDPTVGITTIAQIISQITEYNSNERKAPIFSLSFGRGADKKFLQKLSLNNLGFSRYIYEGADASLQLQDFYRQISSPLLANVTFTYDSSANGVTKNEFPVHFGGSEIVVAGQCQIIPKSYELVGGKLVEVDAWNGHKRITFRPKIIESPTNIERLWAYLTIKQLLEKKEVLADEQHTVKQKALDMALKYSFVTSVSSLVVVKPNATAAVDAEDATGGRSTQKLATRRYSPLRHRERMGHTHSMMATHSTRQTTGKPLLETYVRVVTNTIYQKSSLDTLQNLPWLKNILNNGIITLSKGRYKLGLNETIGDVINCPVTPLGGSGHCKLLHRCPIVYSHLSSVDDFVQHFCELKNEFAGVCCPK